jgi:hypothetical protein
MGKKWNYSLLSGSIQPIKQLRGALLYLKRDIAANLMGWMLPEKLLYSVKTSYEIKELDQKFTTVNLSLFDLSPPQCNQMQGNQNKQPITVCIG